MYFNESKEDRMLGRTNNSLMFHVDQSTSMLTTNVFILLSVFLVGTSLNGLALRRITKTKFNWRSFPLVTQSTVIGLIMSVFYAPIAIIRQWMVQRYGNKGYAFCAFEMVIWSVCEVMMYITLCGIAIQRARTIKATFGSRPSEMFEYITMVISWVCGAAMMTQQIIVALSMEKYTCVTFQKSDHVLPITTLTSLLVCILVMIISYGCSIRFLRKHQQRTYEGAIAVKALGRRPTPIRDNMHRKMSIFIKSGSIDGSIFSLQQPQDTQLSAARHSFRRKSYKETDFSSMNIKTSSHSNMTTFKSKLYQTQLSCVVEEEDEDSAINGSTNTEILQDNPKKLQSSTQLCTTPPPHLQVTYQMPEMYKKVNLLDEECEMDRAYKAFVNEEKEYNKMNNNFNESARDLNADEANYKNIPELTLVQQFSLSSFRSSTSAIHAIGRRELNQDSTRTIGSELHAKRTPTVFTESQDTDAGNTTDNVSEIIIVDDVEADSHDVGNTVEPDEEYLSIAANNVLCSDYEANNCQRERQNNMFVHVPLEGNVLEASCASTISLCDSMDFQRNSISTQSCVAAFSRNDESSEECMTSGRKSSASGKKITTCQSKSTTGLRECSNNSMASSTQGKAYATQGLQVRDCVSNQLFPSSQNEVVLFPPSVQRESSLEMPLSRVPLSMPKFEHNGDRMKTSIPIYRNQCNSNISSQRTKAKRYAIQRAVIILIHVIIFMLPVSILSLLCAQDDQFSAKDTALQTLRGISCFCYVLSPILYVFYNKGIKRQNSITPGGL